MPTSPNPRHRRPATRAEPPFPVIEAKLGPPGWPVDAIDRPRIAAALNAAASARLTLVVGPPGYGKTTAVRTWCAQRGDPVAWTTLDPGDNDPARLWRYVATAVDRVREGLGRLALQRLRVAGAGVDGAVDELANGIAAFGSRLVVVLDDVHTVTDRDCLASLDRAIGHLPPSAHLVLISRTDPALKLARLRAHADLAELRADDLAFDDAEALELVVRRGAVELERSDVEALRRHTEGWPAALVLATHWLRGVDDPRAAVSEFDGSHRVVAEYLSQEVLDGLDDERRAFLLRASALGRFTPALCDAVLERSDSAAMLAELERANLFVTRHERGEWYSVHSLFAEYAALALEPGAAAEIRRRAADWLRGQELPVEAVAHASAAGDPALVADVLADFHLTLIRIGAGQTLLHWASTLPAEELLARPELAAAAATAAMSTGGHLIAKRRFLSLVERARRERPESFTPYAQAVAAMVVGASADRHVGDAVRAGLEAVQVAEADADEVLVSALAAQARALYFAGDLVEAWAAAQRAIEHPAAERRPPGHAFARAVLALVAAERGRVPLARVHAERARAILGGIGSSRSWLGANVAVALAAVFAEEGRHGDAERQLAYAERVFRDEIETVEHVWATALLARAQGRRGRIDGAEESLAAARAGLGELEDPGRVERLVREVDRELAAASLRASGGEILEQPSAAELAVLRLLATDLTAREIGERLYLSPNTIHSHTRAIYRKLGVASRADAVARASAGGLLEQSHSPR